TLSVSTERIEQMTGRYQKLTDYVKRLHAWARSKESQRENRQDLPNTTNQNGNQKTRRRD
ncbi:MAG: hypothetical protein V4671_16065, partial [Armatimonadota bacterium]